LVTNDQQKLQGYVAYHTNGIINPSRERLLHPSLCVLDAIYSIQLKYEVFDDYQNETGLIQNYLRYIEQTRNIRVKPTRGTVIEAGQTEDTLRDLQALFNSVGPDNFGPEVMGDNAGLDGRGFKIPATGDPKSVVVSRFVNYLLDVDPQVSTHAGLEDYANRVNLDAKPWRDHTLRGIGPKTFRYFCMLAGNNNGVKPDIWIRRLVTLIIGGGPHSDQYLIDVVVAVARALETTPKALDNWLWRHARTHSTRLRQGLFPERELNGRD